MSRSSDDAPGSPHRQFSANPGRMIQQTAPYDCGIAQSANANQAVLPVYVLHQRDGDRCGWLLRGAVGVPTLVKYVVISFTALVITLVLYDVGVRRTAVTRVLFGMKAPSRQGARAHVAVAIAGRSFA